MDNLEKILEDVIGNEKMITGILSGLKKKEADAFSKVNVKPVLIKNQKLIQLEYEYKNKVIHKNLESIDAIKEIKDLLSNHFKQG